MLTHNAALGPRQAAINSQRHYCEPCRITCLVRSPTFHALHSSISNHQQPWTVSSVPVQAVCVESAFSLDYTRLSQSGIFPTASGRESMSCALLIPLGLIFKLLLLDLLLFFSTNVLLIRIQATITEACQQRSLVRLFIQHRYTHRCRVRVCNMNTSILQSTASPTISET